MKIIITIVLACLFSMALNILYIQQIGNEFSQGDSSYYLLDAYYYWHLGSVINSISSNDSYFERAFDIAPTTNSTGVVTVASFLNISPTIIYVIPALFLFIYFYLFDVKKNRASLKPLMVIAILVGTAPLPFLVSKESLLYVGILLIARYAWSDSFVIRFCGITAGLVIVAIGRYEVLGFLLISYILSITGSKIKIVLFMIGAIATTIYFNDLYAISLISENVSIGQGIEFCGGYTNSACLTSGASLTTVLATRFLLSILLPLKWVFALFESFAYLDHVSLFWARFSQGLFALIFLRWLYLLTKYKKQEKIKLFNKSLKFGLWFFVTYSLFYALIIFQQPTRQIQFALSVLMIFVTLGVVQDYRRKLIPSSSVVVSSNNNPRNK